MNSVALTTPKNLPSLESKITYRIKELRLSIWEYCGYVKIEEKERDTLIELITVNETYFFREENLLRELQTNILPKFEDYSKEKLLESGVRHVQVGKNPIH